MERTVIAPGKKLDLAALGWIAGWEDIDERNVTDFARAEIRMPGSALTMGDYDPATTPWNSEPLNLCHVDSPVRRIIYVKPVQSGGSSAGECALVYWLKKVRRGNIAYYWETDKKAEPRWIKRVQPILETSPALVGVLPLHDRTKYQQRLVKLPHISFAMLGVISKGNVASDSYRWIICEEVHAWPAGKLKTAEGRTTAYQQEGFKLFVISNASLVGDQLHTALEAGTNQAWAIKCPGCRQFHIMRREWRDDEAHLGGLRYDSNAPGVKIGKLDYNYNRLQSTLRYQMPCGFEQWPDYKERKALSQTGKYSEPRNIGATVIDRSFTLDAVAVHSIDWMELVKEQHLAQKAVRYGDLEPMRKLWQERDCRFWDPQKFLGAERVTLVDAKGEEGLANRLLRTMYVDRQVGDSSKDETPHWWVVIRDWAPNGDSRLVYAGRLDTREEVEEKRQLYSVEPRFVGVDSGADTVNVYRTCAKYGWTAFKGAGTPGGGYRTFSHEAEDGEGVPYTFRRHFSPGEWRDPYHGDKHGRAGTMAVFLILYCKRSIRDHLHYLRTSGEVKWEVPTHFMDGDKKTAVPEEYHEHLRGETLLENGLWKQTQKRIDLLVCEYGNALIAHIAGVIAAPDEGTRDREDVTPEKAHAE